MHRTNGSKLDRLAAGLPGWIFLLSGLTLLGIGGLTPAWLTCRDLGWQLDVMRIRAEQFAAREHRYHDFHAALVEEDPVLIERLAFAELHVQPAGRQLLARVRFDPVARRPTARVQGFDPGRARSTARVGTVATWLNETLEPPGPPHPRPFSSRLTRIATGPSSIVLLAVALICLVAGLAAGRDKSEWLGGGWGAMTNDE